MKRVLVVDDEQHVVDHIVRILEREAPEEFTVAGTASSGRETMEKVPVVQPDLIVMDVKMPGLSGIDTIRELQRRGTSATFLLSTAYERFDIAREALELGITGYLLKPVTKEALLQGLRNAADQWDRRLEVKRREFDLQEQSRQIRGFAVEAFLGGLMLGRASDVAVQGLRAWLGIDKPWGLVAAAGFVHHPKAGRDALESVLQYKTQALCGPLVSDRCLVFQALGSPDDAPAVEAQLLDILGSERGDDLQRGNLRVAFADPRPLDDLDKAWPQALGRLSGRRPSEGPGQFLSGRGFDEEDEFQSALLQGDAERLRFSFESLLSPFESLDLVPVSDRYRIIILLGSALGRLVALGHLEESAAHQAMDFDDLRQAPGGREFCLQARTRLPVITGALNRAQRWSVPLTQAMEYIRHNYGQPLTLDAVADRVSVSPKRLSRHFTEELGQGFSDYLIDFRIEKAKILLSLPGASIKQVSKECGYPDPNYFARLFKKVTGTTPSDFSAIL